MLSAHEKEEIDHEITKFAYKQSACLEALMVVQKHRGYVSDEAIAEVSSYLEMSATELDSVATFYNLIYRKPVGKNVIRVCDSVSCWIMGYEGVKAKIQNTLGIKPGESTSDGLFTLLPAQCLGCCDKAPAMMIGDKLYRNLTDEKVVNILSRYQNGETPTDISHE